MIKILVTGDLCPIGRIEKLAEEKKYAEVFRDFQPYLLESDLNIANLECPLTHSNQKIQKVGPHLKGKTDCWSLISAGKFDLLTLANNHIMDYGEQGLMETLKEGPPLNIATVGAGRNIDQASIPYFREIQNVKVAILNFCESEFSIADENKPGANPLNPVQNYYAIKAASEQSDIVMVIIHGGHEGYALPSPRMVETYRFFADAGADVVIGHHSHCFSGHERYKDKLIFYGLGNFLFDGDEDPETGWYEGFAVQLVIENKNIHYQIIPYSQCKESAGLTIMDETQKGLFFNRLNNLNNIISDDHLLKKEWKNYIQSQTNNYLMRFEFFSNRIYRSLRYRNILPRMISKKRGLRLLNTIRCESHRDLSIASFQKLIESQPEQI